jgi:hypothetical protein
MIVQTPAGLPAAVPGSGNILRIASADPAAGAEYTHSVPAGKIWRIISIVIPFTTAVAVANRRPVLTIDDGANIVYRVPVAADIPASQAAFIVAAPYLPAYVAVNNHLVPLPELILPAGYRIRTATTLIQGADDYGVANLLVEEWDAAAVVDLVRTRGN